MTTNVTNVDSKFFRTVLGSGRGKLCLCFKYRTSGAFLEEFWNWPDDLSKIQERISHHDDNGADCYFCPQLLSEEKRQKKFVLSCPNAWADLDGCAPTGLLVAPTIVLETSPGRYHAFWTFEAPIAPVEAEGLSKRIAYHEGADHSGWDLTQVLRIPGTHNHKYPDKPLVRLLPIGAGNYRLTDFSEYPEVAQTSSVPSPTVTELQDVGSADVILFRYKGKVPKRALELRDGQTEGQVGGGDRSRVFFELVRLLAEAGLTRTEIYSVVQGAQCNKWALDGHPERAWTDIARICSKDSAPKLGPARFFNKSNLLSEQLALDIVANVPLALGADGRIYVYNKGIYEFDEHTIKFAMKDRIGDKYKRSHVPTVEDCVLYELTKLNRTLSSGVIGVPGFAVVNNGILELATGTLREWTPDHFSMNKIPIDWDPQVPCPRYLAWAESIGVIEFLPILEQHIAQALDPSRPINWALMLYGRSRTGKSTFIRIMEHILGYKNRSSVSLHDLCTSTFLPAQLYGKTLNVTADLSSEDVKDLSMFLKLTGGSDTITAQHKYKNAFDFYNQALLLFSMNIPPTVSSSRSREYYNRCRPFPFNKTFEGHEDSTIERDIIENELPGILRRLVEAYQKVPCEDVPEEFRQDFARKSNRVTQWLDEETKPLSVPQDGWTKNADRVQGTPGSELLEDFNYWASQNKFAELGRNTFYEALESQSVRWYHPNRQPRVKWFRIKTCS